jgi:hypothetical protein
MYKYTKTVSYGQKEGQQEGKFEVVLLVIGPMQLREEGMSVDKKINLQYIVVR